MRYIERHIEIPREWTHERLEKLFPGYRVLGTPFGFFARIEQTRCIFVDYSWGELLKAVKSHLKGNELPIPADLSLVLQNEFCSFTESGLCVDVDPESDQESAIHQQASRFLRAVESMAIDGCVEQAEAERRAEICAGCPKNLPEKFNWCNGCSAKTAVAKLAKWALGRSTEKDQQLKTCRLCHCRLQLKVWVNKEAMDEPELQGKWPEWCWMR